MSDDWFRGPEWDASAREAFETRLRRAHASGRPQYLRRKALSLIDAGRDDDAIELLNRSIDEGAPLFDMASAWESLGDIAARQGKSEEAIGYYRRILTEQPSLSGTTGSIEISLAEVLLGTGRRSDVNGALTLLDSWMTRDELKFNSTLFRWHLARIAVAEQFGDHQAVHASAVLALELADSGPQLPRHKDVGLVKTDKATLHRLKRLSK